MQCVQRNSVRSSTATTVLSLFTYIQFRTRLHSFCKMHNFFWVCADVLRCNCLPAACACATQHPCNCVAQHTSLAVQNSRVFFCLLSIHSTSEMETEKNHNSVKLENMDLFLIVDWTWAWAAAAIAVHLSISLNRTTHSLNFCNIFYFVCAFRIFISIQFQFYCENRENKFDYLLICCLAGLRLSWRSRNRLRSNENELKLDYCTKVEQLNQICLNNTDRLTHRRRHRTNGCKCGHLLYSHGMMLKRFRCWPFFYFLFL